MTPDRPTPRTRRPPRAAADERQDPVTPTGTEPTSPYEPTPASTPIAPLPVAAGRGMRPAPEPTVQLNSRVSIAIAQLVDDVSQRTGWSKRTAIEHAIRATYDPANQNQQASKN
jgi:hypothetical protein